MNDRKPRIALIVVTWNSAAVIGGLLESVRATVFDGDLDLYVVDNASGDDTVAVVHALAPHAAVVQTNRNAGYAAAINAGIAAAGDVDAYLLLNPDVRVRRESIRSLWDALAQSTAGIVVPRLVDDRGGLRFSLRREPTIARAWGEALLGGTRAGRISALGEVIVARGAYRVPTRAAWATGAVMLVSRQCAAQVGSWDESYFLYSEETDFALRAADAGWELRLAPGAEFVHHEGDSHASAALFMLLTRNRVALYRSRHGRASTAMFWLAVFAGEALRASRPTRRAAARALLGRTRGMAAPG